MEDDNTKDDPNEPSTSKKASQSNNSIDEDYNENRGGDQRTNIDMSESETYSDISEIEMARTNQVQPADKILKAVAKTHGKKKKTKALAGRIKKRERPPAKRQRKPLKRKPKTKEGRKERDISVSTIFTRLSSSGFQTPGCDRCGHRCCLRRYYYESKKKFKPKRQEVPKYKRINRRDKSKETPVRVIVSEGAQAGSRSKMLSPLFVATNSSLNENLPQIAMSYCEIDLEMIYETLKRLTMWKQEVPTNAILENIAQNYPVNTDKSQLLSELYNKLTIATIVGVVSRSSVDTWGLTHVFQHRSPNENHVTLFWKIYADTLRPVTKKENVEINQQPDMLDKVTDTN